MEFLHKPVLLKECIEGLKVDDNPNGVYLDCTLGGGGHSSEILKRLSDKGLLIGVDKDDEAIAAATKRLSAIGGNFRTISDDFKNARSQLIADGVTQLDGVLIDLGVSGYQLDCADRGFSYQLEGRLDMRMSRSNGLSAYEVVNTYTESRLADIIWRYGEDKLSRRIAKNIVLARQKAPVETTTQLAEIVEKSYPPKTRWAGGNPSKRTFQAIRIEVNGELEGLYECIRDLTLMLKPKGRICVISFHSLEDREVKRCFQYLEADCVCDRKAPICTCGKRKEVEFVTKKPIIATAEELEENSRAKSAKLRIVERI